MGFLDEVFSLAIQSCNMYLDNGDEPKAQLWLQQALAHPKDLLSPERLRALVFTTARHMIFKGDHSSVLNSYAHNGICPTNDHLKRRAVLDAACIGLAYLGKRLTHEAELEAIFISEQLQHLTPNQQLDFAVEGAAQIATELNLDHVTESLRDFVRKRNFTHVRHIPLAFKHLKRLANA
jgi:hypothetical protein